MIVDKIMKKRKKKRKKTILEASNIFSTITVVCFHTKSYLRALRL